MNHQPVHHNPTSIGVKVKAAFQIASVLIICIWSFHQIKNSHYNSLKNKPTHGRMDLGRKGNAGLNDVVVIDFHDGGVTIQRRIIEEKSQDESPEAEGLYKKIESTDDSIDKYTIGIKEFDDENGIPPEGVDYEDVAGNETRSVGVWFDENVLGVDNETEVDINTTAETEELDDLSRSYKRRDRWDRKRPSSKEIIGEMEAEFDNHDEESMVKSSKNMAQVDSHVVNL